MFKKLVETKKSAIEKADYYFSDLKREIIEKQIIYQDAYTEKLTQKQKENITIFNNIVMTPKEYLDFIYNSENFKQYLQYVLVVKAVCKKILFLKIAIVLIAIAISILINMIVENSLVAILIGLVLVIGSIIVVVLQKTDISYEEYYMKTMFELMMSVLPGYSFEESGKTVQEKNKKTNNMHIQENKYVSEKILTKEELEKHFSKIFDYYKVKNTMGYDSTEANGSVCDIEIIKEKEKIDPKTGRKELKEETIFDGFFIKNNVQKPSDVLSEYIIEIREDDNVISSLTEDTIHSIYKSEKEFTFNAEELNKALDCKIKYENIAQKAVNETEKFAKNAINKLINKDNINEENIIEADVDPTLILEKVITPFLEDRFLYLRKRYNSFNMNLANSYISFNVNLNQSFFQKFQAKEIWKNEYKKHTEKVSFIKPSLFSNADFEYYKQFQMLEKIYFVHYINLLYRFALKSNEITLVENDVITRFESEITEIMEQKYSEFKDTYRDEIKQIAGMVKDTISEIREQKIL